MTPTASSRRSRLPSRAAHTTVHRSSPNRRSPSPEAVLLYTARPATVAPYQGPLGQIAPGFEASFITLDRDLFELDPNEIDQTNVEQTWIAGEKIYTRD